MTAAWYRHFPEAICREPGSDHLPRVEGRSWKGNRQTVPARPPPDQQGGEGGPGRGGRWRGATDEAATAGWATRRSRRYARGAANQPRAGNGRPSTDPGRGQARGAANQRRGANGCPSSDPGGEKVRNAASQLPGGEGHPPTDPGGRAGPRRRESATRWPRAPISRSRWEGRPEAPRSGDEVAPLPHPPVGGGYFGEGFGGKAGAGVLGGGDVQCRSESVVGPSRRCAGAPPPMFHRKRAGPRTGLPAKPRSLHPRSIHARTHHAAPRQIDAPTNFSPASLTSVITTIFTTDVLLPGRRGRPESERVVRSRLGEKRKGGGSASGVGFEGLPLSARGFGGVLWRVSLACAGSLCRWV